MRRRGFTLIEPQAVLAIVATAVTLAPLLLRQRSDRGGSETQALRENQRTTRAT